MDDATTALVVLGVVVALFIWNRLPVGVVAILAALGALGDRAGHHQRGGRGLRRPGGHLHRHPVRRQRGDRLHRGDDLAGQMAARAGRHRRTRGCWSPSACSRPLLASLITLNGAVAALLPLVVLLAMRIGQPPSQLLMPVAFAGSCGGLLMLMSSPVNVIVSEAAAGRGRRARSLLLLRPGRAAAAGRHDRDLRGPRAPPAPAPAPRAHARPTSAATPRRSRRTTS